MTIPLMSNRKMAAAGSINLIYLILNSISFLVLTPLTLHVLGAETYGLWTIMLAMIQFAGLANFGTGSAVIKYVAQYTAVENSEKQLSSAITFSFVFMALTGLIVTVLICIFRFNISALYKTQNTSLTMLGDSIGLISIGLLPLFLSQVSTGILLAVVKNGKVGSIQFAQSISLWLGAYLIGLFHGNLLDLGILSLIINILTFLVSTYYALLEMRPFRVYPFLDKTLSRDMFNYSILTWVSSIGIVMFQQLDRVIVGIVIGPSAAGVYGIATSVALRVNLLVGQFTQVLTPFASSFSAKGKIKEIAIAFRQTSRFVAYILLITSTILFVWMDTILKIWISPGFSQNYSTIFRLLIIAYALNSMARPAHQLLTGLGWVKMPAITYMVSGIFFLSTVWILSKNNGLVGAAISNFVFVSLLIMNFYAANKLNMNSIKTLIFDLGLPIFILILLMLLPIQNLIISIRFLVCIAVLSLVILIALGEQQNRLFLKSILYP